MKKLNLKWVAESIGDDYKNWKKGDTVLIQAQTGTGKTWFVKNVLLDYLKTGEKLLFVCNRTNLKRQLKKDLLKKYNQPIPETFEELDDITTIDDKVIISSYHAISESIKNEIYENENKSDFGLYDYIVFDESHFIFADASFNNKNRFAYQKIVKEWHPQTVKIFISATMQEIRNPIINCVEKNKKKGFGLDNFDIHEYSTGIDYSYVDVKYFKNIDVITNLIKNDTSDDKWLIFVSDIEKQANILMKELSENKCSVIKSGTQSDELNSIIKDSKFNKKVLICTKAMDNGINIDDSMLRHIVIMTWDQISFIQMLGRKRVDIDNAEEINLYIPKRFKKSFLSKLHNHNNKKKEIELLNNESAFYKKYDNDLKEFKGLNDVFYRDYKSGKIKINMIGWKRLNEDIKFSEYMIEAFDELGEYAFILEQLKWLDLGHTFSTLNDIGDVIVDDEVQSLENYLDSIVGDKLFTSEQQELSNIILKELITISKDVDYRTKKLKHGTIEAIVRSQLNLPYAVSKPKVEGKGEMRGKRYIIVSKLES
ncbi:DEAD/DEAH box helicase family protein [Bacillus sp. J37]|uniref:DEAD/DEAH box helicase n=1 Tax=Bacillus sp. J37 TaxID=935837 RepID=UPI00047D0D38|nr:DEAD/DEAH box helicase family protein [Bacillus sp. J37]